MMENSKQIRPEWVPSGYEKEEGTLKKQAVVKTGDVNSLVKKDLNRRSGIKTKKGT
jgi:hypothetical protein